MIEVPTIEVAQVPDPIPEGVTVLDVREPVEWQYGRIDGADLEAMGVASNVVTVPFRINGDPA